MVVTESMALSNFCNHLCILYRREVLLGNEGRSLGAADDCKRK